VVKYKKRIIVTSALPYANGEIHIGHLVEYIQTDIFVRFLKLSGRTVIYCCADDTHGTPIELKSRDLGIKPEQLIDRYSKEHQEDFKNFHIKFDSYYSTNSPENKILSDKIFNILLKKGHIYKKSIKVMYSEKSKRFLPDRFIKGECPKCHAKDQYGDVCESCGATYEPTNLIDPYSVTDGSKPILKESDHYFFKLSKLSKFLKDYITTNSTFQGETKNFVLNWIKDGLEDWDISRDGPYFGFKIPGEKNKFYYVWLDAPIGYISSLANYFKGDTNKAEKIWNESDIIHFIGKDITYFHFLFWPAMLYAAGFKLPQSIFVHGFLTVGGEKMSKSRGTFLTAKEFLKKYDAEHLRFYYANVLSKKLADINLDFKEFKDRINNELVGNLGNFCYRVISFTNKNFNGKIDGIEDEKKIISDIKHRVNSISKHYEELNFNSVIHEILQISDIGNRYFQKNEPWSLIKDDRIKVQKVCGLCVNITKILSILIGPILPLFSKNLQNQLNLENLGWNDLQFDIITHKIGKEKLLVRKLEEVEQQTFPLNLRVAEIVDIKDHPNAEKLYILKINLGSEVRQLVAGLKEYYPKDELKGKKIIVITNLKYAKIRGVESQGMLLAAEDSNNVGILTVKKSKPGTQITCGTLESSVQQISFEKFQMIKIIVEKGKVICEGSTLKAGTEYLYPEKIKGEAKVR
jgi:methionyl-tRNA synthetase